MKSKYIPYFVIAFINFCFVLSAVYYPPLRDELYYLYPTKLNVFQEYGNAYFVGNPRIGQFFCNLISRHLLLKIIFELLTFNSLIVVFFLLTLRRLPVLRNVNDLLKLIIIAGLFIFLINYFGEMFYYTPFITNYTFTTIIYLLYIFIVSEYYLNNNNILENHHVNIFLIIFSGIFIGMCNEHVPPVLIGASFLALFWNFFIKKKKIDYKIAISHISLVAGYLLLFFAPANRVKFKVVGKQSYGFNIWDYLKNFKCILNLYRYYNLELVLFLVSSVILVLFLYRKKSIQKIFFIRLLIFFLLGLLCIPIVAYSPLLGTRLLFFTNAMFLVVIFSIYFKGVEVYKAQKISTLVYIFTSCFSVSFFIISVLLSYNGRKNYSYITSQIAEARRTSKNVILSESFNFYTDTFGNFNRRIFLENGEEYIDSNINKDTSEEMNLKTFYNLNNLSVKNKH